MSRAMLDRAKSEHVDLAIDGRSFDVLTLDGREAVSQLFDYQLQCASTVDGPAPSELVGHEARMTVRDGSGHSRDIRGVVCDADERIFDAGRALLSLRVRPDAFRLTLGRSCRTFLDKSVPDIVEEVASAAGVELRRELTDSYPSRPYTVQYREADWAFVCRLLEAEGIYYWFDHAAASLLVLSDRSDAAPDLVGGAAIVFAGETGMQASRENIHQLGHEARVRTNKVAIASFDPDHPKLAVKASAGEGRFESYDAPGGGPTSPAACQALADRTVEGAKAAANAVGGESSSVRLAPGRVVAVEGTPPGSLAGRYFVTRAHLSVAQRQQGTGGLADAPPHTRFGGIEGALRYRPPVVTPVPRQPGIQTGAVVGPPDEDVHPDDKGQVRLQMHWDREGAGDDNSGTWMRVGQRGTAGSMLLPRTSWNMVTMNEEGSVDRPMVLSRLFDAEHPPPYPLPANKTRTVFKTPTTPGGGSSNEIRFEDRAGAEEMFIHSTRDMNVLVQNKKTEVVKANHARQVANDHALDVRGNTDETVVVDQSIRIGGNESEAVGSMRAITVNGNEDNSVGAARKVDTGASLTTDVSGQRTLKVPPAQLDITFGDVRASAPQIHTLVGGAAIKLTLGSLSEAVGKSVGLGATGLSAGSFGGVLQTVGGAKIELSRGKRTINPDLSYLETVGGMLGLVSNASYNDVAKASTIETAVALTAVAPELMVQGAAAVTLCCGTSSIVLSVDGVTISADTIDLTEAELVDGSGGPTVKIN
jgi:type VI secretion system secreted protein VgrG